MFVPLRHRHLVVDLNTALSASVTPFPIAVAFAPNTPTPPQIRIRTLIPLRRNHSSKTGECSQRKRNPKRQLKGNILSQKGLPIEVLEAALQEGVGDNVDAPGFEKLKVGFVSWDFF